MSDTVAATFAIALTASSLLFFANTRADGRRGGADGEESGSDISLSTFGLSTEEESEEEFDDEFAKKPKSWNMYDVNADESSFLRALYQSALHNNLLQTVTTALGQHAPASALQEHADRLRQINTLYQTANDARVVQGQRENEFVLFIRACLSAMMSTNTAPYKMIYDRVKAEGKKVSEETAEHLETWAVWMRRALFQSNTFETFISRCRDKIKSMGKAVGPIEIEWVVQTLRNTANPVVAVIMLSVEHQAYASAQLDSMYPLRAVPSNTLVLVEIRGYDGEAGPSRYVWVDASWSLSASFRALSHGTQRSAARAAASRASTPAEARRGTMITAATRRYRPFTSPQP